MASQPRPPVPDREFPAFTRGCAPPSSHTAWLTATAIACDLRAWLQLLALDGDLAKATPKTLRYRVLHVPARLVRGQRRRRLWLPATWPWADAVVRALNRIKALPRPT